jgi:hypothetical protein
MQISVQKRRAAIYPRLIEAIRKWSLLKLYCVLRNLHKTVILYVNSILYFFIDYVNISGDLLSLLQWRQHPDRIQETLMRVYRLGDKLLCEELVKFLQDVLDALFALFSTEDGNRLF